MLPYYFISKRLLIISLKIQRLNKIIIKFKKRKKNLQKNFLGKLIENTDAWKLSTDAYVAGKFLKQTT